MAAKIWIGVKSRATHLRRLSVVFAVELRLKIVTELYMREMSPKQFYKEFGGGSLSRVDKNFKRLESHGWLRFVRRETGGLRRGAYEHFYRAPELAYFDNDSWALLPYSLRFAFSLNAFKQIAMRLREAMEELAFDARPNSHLACEPLLLDPLGWERVVGAFEAEFASIYEEQVDAGRRVYHSGEELFRANVVLFAFESPTPGGKLVEPSLATSYSEPFVSIPERLSKVFADELCLQIVEQANLQDISPRWFHAEIGGYSLSQVSRRFKTLRDLGWLKKIDEKTGGSRRGAVESFYRAAGPEIPEDDPWDDVPDSLKSTQAWITFEYLTKQVKEAMKAGTFDARDDRYLAWSLLSLDRQGLAQVTADNEALLEIALKEHERTKDRIKRSHETPMRMTIALAAFESPVEAKEL